MSRSIVTFVAATLLGVSTAYSQEIGAGAGRMEIAAFPGGGIVFTESGKGAEPDFTNYALGGSFTLNVNRWIGFEGEVGGSFGVRQNLTFNREVLTDQKTPNTWNYMGNVVYNPVGNDRTLVPYATGGLGGLTMSDSNASDVANLGVTRNETYLTGNAGGGLKWFATRHAGLRLDYRLFMINNKDTAPLFFGREDRYAHRVYGGLLLTY